jgi:SAM-dependent methyltransferase
MTPKQIAKKLLPPLFVDAVRWMKNRYAVGAPREPIYNGVPWSPGFYAHKVHFIQQAMADESLLQRFRRRQTLPTRYGVGIDERGIEYPWLVAHLQSGAEVLLDAGSVLNFEFMLNVPVFQGKTIHILTLAPEPSCFWKRGISYLFCDLRDVPIRDDYYDTIACISTIEHVGCDNTHFTGSGPPDLSRRADREERLEHFELALREMARILKPGGRLFLTVPYGVHRNLGLQQVFNRELLSRAIAAFGDADEVIETFYRYTAEGWNVAEDNDCADCQYVEWISRAWQHNELPNPIPVEPDKAAAARAVACVQLVKRTIRNL